MPQVRIPPDGFFHILDELGDRDAISTAPSELLGYLRGDPVPDCCPDLKYQLAYYCYEVNRWSNKVRETGQPSPPPRPPASLYVAYAAYDAALYPNEPAGQPSNAAQDDEPPEAAEPPVRLGKRDEHVWVLGIPKGPLTKAQFELVKALEAAGAEGVNKDDIEAVRSDARRILRKLRDSDPAWAAVIHMPGGKGRGGYRIADPRCRTAE